MEYSFRRRPLALRQLAPTWSFHFDCIVVGVKKQGLADWLDGFIFSDDD